MQKSYQKYANFISGSVGCNTLVYLIYYWRSELVIKCLAIKYGLETELATKLFHLLSF